MNGREAILLVDDDRNEVDVALRALDRAGIEADVAVARDGLEALQALGLEAQAGDGSGATAAPLPSVVFLDLKMPRVDGWEVLRRMRQSPRTADIPVVVFSSSNRAEDIERSYALGADSYLLKRFDPTGPGSYFADAARYWLSRDRDSNGGGGVS